MSQLMTSIGLTVMLSLAVSVGHGMPESSSETMSYTRMYADDSGETHFEDKTVDLEALPDVPKLEVTPFTQATSVGFLQAEVGLDMDWHPAPRRQWIFILSGTLEVEVQDGEVRQFPTGSILFVEDTIGKGHKTRVVGETAVYAAWVPVGPE